MARLPRLVVPGLAHLILQRGHDGKPVFTDGSDRGFYVAALRAAAADAHVAVHAHALADSEVLLLATPEHADGLGRMVQTVGRLYVGGHNRRHGRSGTLWDGRFRCAVVEPGATLLKALLWVDTVAAAATGGGAASAAHRTGGPRDPLLQDPAEVWALGNTPFDREARYRALLADGLLEADITVLRRAAVGGWPLGSDEFLSGLALQAGRAVTPRRPGRPRKQQRLTGMVPAAERKRSDA